MSWSKGFNKRALDNPEELAAARATVVNQNGEEAAAQFDVACKAAKTVIESGAVGSETKDFSIYLSGHSNPSHEPTPGWSNDTVTVSITQVSVPATAGV